MCGEAMGGGLIGRQVVGEVPPWESALACSSEEEPLSLTQSGWVFLALVLMVNLLSI